LTRRDFEPVGVLDFGISSVGILACRDFEFQDFGPYPIYADDIMKKDEII
jgi:hypothetical protein